MVRKCGDPSNQPATPRVSSHVTRPRPRRLSRTVASSIALAWCALLSGCGGTSVATDDVAVGDRLLPAGVPRFVEPRLTWAQGRTLHYGDRTFRDVVGRDIVGLLRTPSGFFLSLGDDEEREHHDVVHWDGETVTEVSSSISTFEVSQDGRYAGWLERDPEGSRGGLAAVRVVDLTTGLAVISTTDGMGDPQDGPDQLAELYANAWPHFAGFDAADRAYWGRAAGDPRDVRRDLVDDPDVDQPGVDDGEGFPRSMLWEGNRGFRALGTAAAGLPESWPPLDGLVTPDGEVLVDEGNGSVDVYRREAPRRVVRLPTGHRFAWFHGWADLGEHRIVLLARDRDEQGHDPAAPDGTTGWIVVCDVDESVCDERTEVAATRSVVFDDGLRGAGV